MNKPLPLLFFVGFLSVAGLAFGSESYLDRCLRRLESLADQIERSQLVEAHHGGSEVLGGFTTVKTGKIITSQVSDGLVKSLYAERPNLPNPQGVDILPESPRVTPVTRFLKSHSRMGTALLNRSGRKWKWESSGIRFADKRFQSTFHHHMAQEEEDDPDHEVTRQLFTISLGRMGTVLKAGPNGDVYESDERESTAFNEATFHMSPEKPGGLFAFSFYTPVPE